MAPTSWSADEIRRVGYAVVDLIAEHLSSMRERPVFRPVPRDVVDRLSRPAPSLGASPDEILREFREVIEPFPFGNEIGRAHV